MPKPHARRLGMADSFSRGYDILRLGLGVHARAIGGLMRAILIACALGTLAWTVWSTTLGGVYAALRWGLCHLAAVVLQLDFAGIPVETTGGPEHWTAAQVAADPWHRAVAGRAWTTLLMTAVIAFGASAPLGIAVFGVAIWRGREATAELLARGQRLIGERALARLVKARGRASRFRIGAIPVPESALNRNILFLGAPQTGKSVSIKRWLREARRRGDMAVVFDKVGDVVEGFYDPARGDVLMNPLDARAPDWSPWSEMRDIADATRIAKSMIPSADGANAFFHEGAQALFAALLTRVWRLPRRSLLALLEAALVWEKAAKAELLAGTDAAKHYQGEHRSGHDVDATMAVFTQALRFLPRTAGRGRDFSIRDFLTETVARLEARPAEALAAIRRRFADETATAAEARAALARGDLRRALRHVGAPAIRWPLLPEGLAAPRDAGQFSDWWARHGAAVEAHWRAQDDAAPEALAALEAAHRAAAGRLRARGAPWLFIASTQRDLPAVRPVISLWLDAVADTILSLPENRGRRIWVFLDELQALQELPSLQPLLTEGAKYGACVVAGVQNMGQLRASYGRDRAEVLLSLFQTKVIFRLPEPDTARWCQAAIGDAVVEHVHESIRYGTSETMDGAQLSIQRATEPIVMAGDVMRQPDLHAYVVFPGDWPVGAAQLRFDPARDRGEKIAPALVRRPIEDTIHAALDHKGWRPTPGGEESDPGAAARNAARLVDDAAPARDEAEASPRTSLKAAADDRDTARQAGAAATPDASKADGPMDAGRAVAAAGREPRAQAKDDRRDARPSADAPAQASARPTRTRAARTESSNSATPSEAVSALPRPPLSDLAQAAVDAATAGRQDARKPRAPAGERAEPPLLAAMLAPVAAPRAAAARPRERQAEAPSPAGPSHRKPSRRMLAHSEPAAADGQSFGGL